jgi:dTDP-4-dehydrorhamnose reductase
MKKIYMAGSGGMLGAAFHSAFSNDYCCKFTDIDVNEDWLSLLDFRDRNSYQKDVECFNPDFLFHLGAYTDLEFCEENEEDTYMTNTLSVENAVFISNKLDIPLLYISTAGIFDGKKDSYDDWDTPNPLGTPTYTHDFVATVKNLIENEYWGLYNCVCGGETSRYEVAEELVKIIGLENDVELVSVTSDYFKEVYYAERPPSERLVTRKLNLRGVSSMRDWREALKIYLDSEYKNYLA